MEENTTAGGWFPTNTSGSDGWRLDIVSLLAVIGESAMAEHSQAITASWFGVLPRIIPAPQALLKPTRPTRMPSKNAAVVGVKNGTFIQALNYFPNIIHPLDEMKPFSFQYWRIKHSQKRMLALQKNTDEWNQRELQREAEKNAAKNKHDAQEELRGLPKPVTSRKTPPINTNVEFHKPVRSSTMKSIIEVTRKATHSNLEHLPPHVPAKLLSPLNCLAIFSCLLTIGLFIWSAWNNDGVACLALGTISLASSIIGYASLWSPQLMKRNSQISVRAGDVVIRTREGAFIVVECDENVARELYSGTEECTYVVRDERLYRSLVGVGTFFLMVSVVLLGNCNFRQQAAIGFSYILLNGLYWGAALLKPSTIWDMTMYEKINLTAEALHGLQADQGNPNDPDPDKRPSFTRTMWYAIRETKDVGWVRKSGAAPDTDEWNKWLIEAGQQARAGNREWNAVQRKDELVGTSETGDARSPVNSSHINGIEIQGGQQAPAIAVPLDAKK